MLRNILPHSSCTRRCNLFETDCDSKFTACRGTAINNKHIPAQSAEHLAKTTYHINTRHTLMDAISLFTPLHRSQHQQQYRYHIHRVKWRQI